MNCYKPFSGLEIAPDLLGKFRVPKREMANGYHPKLSVTSTLMIEILCLTALPLEYSWDSWTLVVPAILRA